MRLAWLLMLWLGGCAAHAGEIHRINSSPAADRYGWSCPYMPVQDGHPPSPIA